MALASVGNLGSNQVKAAGTTVVLTTTAAVAQGGLIVVVSSWDNIEATDGETSRLSCADSVGNTYTKVKEYTRGSPGAAAGVTLGVFYAKATTALPLGGTITVTGTSVTAKTIQAAQYSRDTAKEIFADAVYGSGSGTDPAAISTPALPSGQYLYVFSIG